MIFFVLFNSVQEAEFCKTEAETTSRTCKENTAGMCKLDRIASFGYYQ